MTLMDRSTEQRDAEAYFTRTKGARIPRTFLDWDNTAPPTSITRQYDRQPPRREASYFCVSRRRHFGSFSSKTAYTTVAYLGSKLRPC